MGNTSTITGEEAVVEERTEKHRDRTDGPISSQAALTRLISACRDSEALLITASEHAQSRGVKLLLKVYAFHRRNAAEELAASSPQENVQEDVKDDPIHGLHQGVVDIQAAMTVGRENRTHVVLEELLKQEDQLASTYKDVLARADLPEHLQRTVQRQYDREQIAHQQLLWLQKDGFEDLVVRLFDDDVKAEAAIEHLTKLGIDERYVNVAKVEDLPIYPINSEAMSGATKNTVAAGMVTGGVAGAILGLVYAALHWLVPAVSATISVGPLWVFLSSVAIGAFWGGVLGFFIGKGTREDDTYLYDESLREGDTLLVVHANDSNLPDVLETLELYHQRELDE